MSLISSIIGSSQTSKAVNAQVGAGNTAISGTQAATTAAQNDVLGAGSQANATLADVNTNEQANLNPYLQLGGTAATGLNTAISPGGALTNQFSFDPTQIAQNPDYQFQLQQGTQAVQRAAAANGTLQSGGTLKAIDQFSQGLASNEIAQAYGQALGTFNANRTATLQNFSTGINAGQTATGQSNAAFQNFGDQSSRNLVNTNEYAGTAGVKGQDTVNSLLLGIGNAKAAGSVQQGNIWGGFVGGSGGAQLGQSIYENTPDLGSIGNAAAGLLLGAG